MTPIDANSNANHSTRAEFLAFVAVVAGLLALNLLLKFLIPRFSGRQEWVVAVMLGAWACESILFGGWAVLGFGAGVFRLLVTVPCLLMLYAVPALIRADYVLFDRIYFVSIALTMILIFFASIILFSALRRATGWRVRPPGDFCDPESTSLQFSMKQLLGALSIYVLLFGVASQIRLSPVLPTLTTITIGPSLYFSTSSFRSALAAVVVLPTATVPIFLLRHRVAIQAFLLAGVIWFVVTVLAVASFVYAESIPILTVLLYTFLMQLGAACVGLLAALPLRWAGCRLISGC